MIFQKSIIEYNNSQKSIIEYNNSGMVNILKEMGKEQEKGIREKKAEAKVKAIKEFKYSQN